MKYALIVLSAILLAIGFSISFSEEDVPKFSYQQPVEAVCGFYKGFKGIATDYHPRSRTYSVSECLHCFSRVVEEKCLMAKR